jgi:hypothetical protein
MKATANPAFMRYVSAFIGLMIVIIIAVQVTIPTTITAISDAALTGTTATVVGLIPLMIGVVLLMLVVGMMGTQ